jgi:hypothetical protein
MEIYHFKKKVVLNFEKWFNKNEVNLIIIAAETKADMELCYDNGDNWFLSEQYHLYLQIEENNIIMSKIFKNKGTLF